MEKLEIIVPRWVALFRNNSCLDAVAHGVNPQDLAAWLFQAPRFIDEVTDNSKRVAPGVSVALPKGARG